MLKTSSSPNASKRIVSMISVSLLLWVMCAACDDSETPAIDQGADSGDRDLTADTRSHDGPVADLTGDTTTHDGPTHDGPTHDGPTADLATSFSCGATKTCTKDQYCRSSVPGVCSGPPVPDSGTCPPDCSPNNCGGKSVCICTSYSCKPLPTGCSACPCLKLPVYCSCKGTAGSAAGIQVNCPGA